MGNADEIGPRHSSGSEATKSLRDGKISAEASASDPCNSSDDVTCDKSGCIIDEEGVPSSPVSRGPGSEPGFRPDRDGHDDQAGDAEGTLHAQTLHGHPITVSQCIFQAHIGRVSSVAEARAIVKDVLEATKREAAFANCVGPFAYRLACVGGRVQQPPRNVGERRHGLLEKDCDGEEGYRDNGDVGSGEKLLHLLQKWDVRHRVLMVTRIDGGFMKAELMGIRRYKFVVDRAKRLLDSTDLVSLRRAVATDIHPPTTAESNASLTAHEAAASGRYCPLPVKQHHVVGGGGCGGTDVPLEDSWDQFVVPLATRRRISGHTPFGNLLGAPRASGGAAPRKVGGGGLRARHDKAGVESSRARERRALSLSQLSISSKTIPFPRGHVPSVMGDKGYGKKRGRINHFAVRTPPPSSSGDDDNNSSQHDHVNSMASGIDAGENPAAAGSPDDAQGVHTKASGWSLPHELDPTSKVTDPEKHREGSNRGWANCSINTAAGASRASTCDTINSPSRIAAIMLGVIPRISSDHPLHPPPPAAAVAATGRYHPREIRRALPPPFTHSSEGTGSSSSAGLCRGVLSRVDTASSSVGMQHGTRAGGGDIADDDAAWPGRGRSPHRPTGSGGCCAMTGAAGDDRRNVTDIHDRIFPPARIGGTATNKNSDGGSHALPLLHRTPGMCLRDRPPPPLAILAEGGDGSASAAAAGAPPPLSNESMMDRWKSDDDRSSSIGIGADCGIRPGAEDDEDTSAGDPPRHRAGSAGAPSGGLLGGTIFVPNTGDGKIAENGGSRQGCETPATWGSDDLTDFRGLVVGRSDPPPTRSKSAIRGWSVNRAVPACSPLATEERPATSERR